LQGLGRFAEAVAAYDEAVDLYRRLVEQQGRAELANDLAGTLVNKALALEQQEHWPDALACYDEAIRWPEERVRAGMAHLLPDLLRTIRYRMMTFLDLQRWDEAAADLARALDHTRPSPQDESAPERVQRELAALFARVRALAPEQ